VYGAAVHSQNSLILVVAVASAALFAGLRREPAPHVDGARATPESLQRGPDDPDDDVLPAGHPPIGDLNAAPDPTEAASGQEEEPAAITWRAPASFVGVPNRSAMRLATYEVAGKSAAEAAELSIVRAGGSPTANLDRWVAQFTDATAPKRAEKTTNGLRISTIEIGGTFSGGMGPGDAARAHPGWMLEGAVVEATRGTYFFKLTGPSATVTRVRADFDALVASIAPADGAP